MEKSGQINELAVALNKAQNQMGGAVKDAKNPFFKSKYADLSAVVKAVKDPFADNGLSYSQFPIYQDGLVGVETILMHTSGQFISGTLLLPMTKKDPQAAGSAITYARRYSLQAVAGIPSEDDDGNMAVKDKGFELDATAKQWVEAAKQDKTVLDQIEDPKYRKFIEGKL